MGSILPKEAQHRGPGCTLLLPTVCAVTLGICCWWGLRAEAWGGEVLSVDQEEGGEGGQTPRLTAATPGSSGSLPPFVGLSRLGGMDRGHRAPPLGSYPYVQHPLIWNSGGHGGSRETCLFPGPDQGFYQPQVLHSATRSLF